MLTDMLNEQEWLSTQMEAGPASAHMTADEWSRELHAWAASHPVSTAPADDSRENIYSGRGE
jgi:hypothetical protein